MFVLAGLLFKQNKVISGVSTIFQLAFYMISANLYFWTQVNTLWFMFRKHKFEFRRHAARQIALLIVTPLSIWLSSIDACYWGLDAFCTRDTILLEASAKNAGLSHY